MFGKQRRELYLLTRGEQRALVVVTFLLLLSLMLRITMQFLPGREPAGVEEFEREARAMMAAFAQADSMEVNRAEISDRKRSGQKQPVTSKDRIRAQNKPSRRINLNRADSVQLLPLPGIGPVFAGRIIKYRRLLGGFVSVNQLAEVYGMPVETIERIRSMIAIDSSAIKMIQLDSATFGELLRHPYLEYEEVKALVEYRDFAGRISSFSELLENHILPDTTIRRMVGYFDFR